MTKVILTMEVVTTPGLVMIGFLLESERGLDFLIVCFFMDWGGSCGRDVSAILLSSKEAENPSRITIPYYTRGGGAGECHFDFLWVP
jgi:hypothetical protein